MGREEETTQEVCHWWQKHGEETGGAARDGRGGCTGRD